MTLTDKSIQEYKEIFEKEYGRKISNAEAAEGARNLLGLFEILYEHAEVELRRKMRLNKEKIKGFYLEPTEGPYTCAICGENYPGNDIWWNPKGLRCRDCWTNIQKKVIPSLYYDSDDKVWIKEWKIQSDFGIHPATRRKLERQGILKGRYLKRKDGTIYYTVYIIKENEKFLKTYKREPKIKVKFVNKSEG